MWEMSRNWLNRADRLFYISRMTKNVSAACLLGLGTLAVLATGCEKDEDGSVYQGIIELDERALGFEEPGRLIELLVHEGDMVESGAVLARLDPTLARLERDARAAEVDAAEAQLSLVRSGSRPEELEGLRAQLNAARGAAAAAGRAARGAAAAVRAGAVASSVADQRRAEAASAAGQAAAIQQQLQAHRGGARAEEVQGSEARVDAAHDALAFAEERLSRLTLRAPLRASVVAVHANPGEVVPAGTPIVTLADPAHPYVDIFVPQGEIRALGTGRPMRVQTDAHPAPLPGRVEHVGQMLEFTPRFLFSESERPNLVVRVRVRIEDPSHNLRAGIPAFARAASEEPSG
jgi:HlyD family secretion protein